MKILFAAGEHNYGNPQRGVSYEFANFLPAFRNMGHEIVHFEIWDKRRYRDFAELNRAFVECTLAECPDVIFCVFMTYEIWIDSLEEIRRRLPAVLVHWGTDDSWKYDMFSRWMAPAFDIYATTSQDAYSKATKEGHLNFVLSQWAANSRELQPPIKAAECKYAVTFVGSAYGNRHRWISDLRERGISVSCFGYGWEGGAIPAADIPAILRNSVISLNFGDSGWVLKGLRVTRSRQIKARVFEVPGAGGFLISEGADGMDLYYRIGEEVVVVEGLDQMAEKIKYYLANPNRRDEIALKGYMRTKQCHTYEHRFTEILQSAEQLLHGRRHFDRSCPAAYGDVFAAALARHCPGHLLRFARWLLVGVFSVIVGKRRGARAARRVVYEISWRISRDKTYRSGGIPGRIFYQES